jgi:Tfp pilus assembly protein PilV
MKIPHPSMAPHKRRDGVAVIVMLILLAMVLGFILINAATLSALHADVKRIEQRQLHRLNAATTQAPPAVTTTNSPAAAAPQP